MNFFLPFSGKVSDLHARICKTYVDAVKGEQQTSLSTLFGGIVGDLT